ncbi:MAG: DCC1-like thiol-disulfide oxidoreductase family protein [Flavobacteriaceae bacterium]
MENNKKIILFDGVCNLCNGAVQFIIKQDKNEIFQFAPLQGAIGKKLTSERNIDVGKVDSIILIEPGKAYYIKSDAVLKIGMELRNYGTISYVLNLIPSTLRNIVYDYVAKNRYQWYGKRDQCMVPSPELNAKFLHS